jgi:hypothetical protein
MTLVCHYTDDERGMEYGGCTSFLINHKERKEKRKVCTLMEQALFGFAALIRKLETAYKLVFRGGEIRRLFFVGIALAQRADHCRFHQTGLHERLPG